MYKFTLSILFLMGALVLGCGKDTPAPAVLPEQVLLSLQDSSMAIGSTGSIQAQVLPENATDKTVDWSSSDPFVATVDANGRYQAHNPGVAIITATTRSGKIQAEVGLFVNSDMMRLRGWLEYISVPGYSLTAIEVYMDNASNKPLSITNVELYNWNSLVGSNPRGASPIKVDAQTSRKHVFTYDVYSNPNSYSLKVYFTLGQRDYVMTIYNSHFTTEIVNNFPIGIDPDWDEGNTVGIPEE